MGTWAAYDGFNQIVESMSGDINDAAFLDGRVHGENRPAGHGPAAGLRGKRGTPPAVPKGYDRLFNHCVVFSKFEEGKLVPLTTDFEDVTKLALGKPQ